MSSTTNMPPAKLERNRSFSTTAPSTRSVSSMSYIVMAPSKLPTNNISSTPTTPTTLPTSNISPNTTASTTHPPSNPSPTSTSPCPKPPINDTPESSNPPQTSPPSTLPTSAHSSSTSLRSLSTQNPWAGSTSTNPFLRPHRTRTKHPISSIQTYWNDFLCVRNTEALLAGEQRFAHIRGNGAVAFEKLMSVKKGGEEERDNGRREEEWIVRVGKKWSEESLMMEELRKRRVRREEEDVWPGMVPPGLGRRARDAAERERVREKDRRESEKANRLEEGVEQHRDTEVDDEGGMEMNSRLGRRSEASNHNIDETERSDAPLGIPGLLIMEMRVKRENKETAEHEMSETWSREYDKREARDREEASVEGDIAVGHREQSAKEIENRIRHERIDSTGVAEAMGERAFATRRVADDSWSSPMYE